MVKLNSLDRWYYGLTIAIDHGNNYHTYYSHLNAVQPGISQGTFVEAGQIIGESGDSGTEGSWHLHFGVRHGADWDNGGYSTDPFGWRGSHQDPLVNFPTPGAGETATCLWAGVPGDDISCSDIIVEDDGAGWDQYPSWDDDCGTSSTSWARCDHGNGFRYHWTNVWDPADFWVRWTPPLRHRGYYQLYAFIPAENATTSSARYSVVHEGGVTFTYVDQLHYYDTWAALSVYELSPGHYGYLYDYTGEPAGSRRIAADGMKFTASVVHLPDVMNSGGWTSSIVIRNNSDSFAQVAINYYNTSGGRVSYQTTTVAGNSSTTGTPPSSFSGSAVVVASQDVSVVVVNTTSSKAYAYPGIPNAPSVSGIGTGTELFVPSHLRNYYGWYSTLYVQNTGGTVTTAHAYFYNDNGSLVDHDTATVNPNGRVSFSSLTGASTGSVRVTASQPLAVVVRFDHASMDSFGYVGASSGGSTGHLPTLFKNYYGWTSSYQTQETAGSSVSVSVRYYPGSYRSFGLSSRGHREVYVGTESSLYGSRGSAKEWVASGSGRVATAVHHAHTYAALGYNGFIAGARDLTLPHLKRGIGGWDASLTVQNVGAANAQVTVNFYHGNGSWAGSFGPFTLSPGYSRELGPELPSPFEGSAWVHSDGADVVAVVHEAYGTGRHYGYGAVP